MAGAPLARTYRFNLNASRLSRGDVQLRAAGLDLRFGGVQALAGVGLEVHQGDIHAVIGPNGAGKTSLLNCVSGLYRPQKGSLVFINAGSQDAARLGHRRTYDLLGTRPDRIARAGVARTFQNIELFKRMTVLENLMLGRHVHMSHHVLPSMLWFGPALRQEVEHRHLVEEVIDFLDLQAVRSQTVGALAYGLQKRVELGRALCLQPALLLLDEPTAGMNVEERETLVRYVLDVNQLAGVTTVLIEHDMGVVMDISDRVTVLNFGRVIADGTTAAVSADPAVIDAYLGEEHR